MLCAKYLENKILPEKRYVTRERERERARAVMREHSDWTRTYIIGRIGLILTVLHMLQQECKYILVVLSALWKELIFNIPLVKMWMSSWGSISKQLILCSIWLLVSSFSVAPHLYLTSRSSSLRRAEARLGGLGFGAADRPELSLRW